MSSESFSFRIHVLGEDRAPAPAPRQVTKRHFLDYIRRRWSDPYVQREMVKYFAKYPGNSLNQVFGRLDEIAARFENQRDAEDNPKNPHET